MARRYGRSGRDRWSSWGGFGPYVSVAERRAKAEREAAKQTKKGTPFSGVVSKGRNIADSWWGRAWCRNLEAFSDYANRLPRGRSYLSNGSVIDLRLEAGRIDARVMGSSLYAVKIDVARLPKARWKRIAEEIGGKLGTIVELLEGRFSDAIMSVLARPREGLFPAPSEITLSCSCPDWATMCKHVAAVLYGVGVRLDDDPRLLFLLRHVDESELVAKSADVGALARRGATKGPGGKPARELELDARGLEAMFGIDLVSSAAPPAGRAKKGKPARKDAVEGAREAKASPSAAAGRGKAAPKRAPVAKPKTKGAASTRPAVAAKTSTPKRSAARLKKQAHGSSTAAKRSRT